MFQSVTSQLPMIYRIITILILLVLFDTYAFQTIKTLVADATPQVRKITYISYWGLSAALLLLLALSITGQFANASRAFIIFTRGIFFAVIVAKVLMIVPLLIEDVYRIFNKVYTLLFGSESGGDVNSEFFISRKKFISQVSAGIGGLTVAGLSYGVMKGAYDYKLHRKTIGLKQLPNNFNGLTIGHISDIHSGSFWDLKAVEKGIRLLMAQKPDVIFFTGDLVNDIADEMTDELIHLFSQVKAPMGVYSCLGNHDYGDYYNWPDKHIDPPFAGAKSSKEHMTPMQAANLDKLMDVHKRMGWNLLMNEHRILERGEDKIAILGIENFGAKGRFPKYGKMKNAHAGTEGIATKLLLSHDPSHWEYEVLKKYQDISVMFAGHTHGAQFGIETAKFKWSPVKYIYKQWAGLYSQNDQHLYVNRGFGFLGYPGRLGIRPEISILTLSNV